MSIVFSEFELRDLFIKSSDIRQSFRSPRNFDIDIAWKKEHRLGSGKKIDLIFNHKDRFIHLIEFKIYADHNAIIQLYEYYTEFADQYLSDRIIVYKLTIAAQYFSDDMMFFAHRLNIELVQVCPINKQKAKLNYLLFSNAKRLF